MCSSLLLSSPLVSRAPGKCLCFVLLSNIHRHFPDCRRFSDNCACYIILTLFSSLYCFYICRRSTRHFFPSYCPPYYPTGKETVAARIGYTWSVPKEHSGSRYLETPKRMVPLASLVCSLAIKTLGKTGCSSLTHYHTLAEQNKKKRIQQHISCRSTWLAGFAFREKLSYSFFSSMRFPTQPGILQHWGYSRSASWTCMRHMCKSYIEGDPLGLSVSSPKIRLFL